MGHVSYRCVEDVFIPTDHQTCSQYDSTALTRTLNYRVMGDIWNVNVFRRLLAAQVKLEHAKNLHPLVPVIQCSSFVSGPSGSVFNGEVVGMMVLVSEGYDIAVHVTLLREFMKIVL
ncbi:hypothetical protein HS088_TW02G00214 [Tripterygium wilfordii]|uniref:Uncharacterized protein n=1 Tax=Tripterygium wilfordii TaxID=458696 RepID=A0A7J7DYE3_TRIWF|nr:hypothetical protein HS088_TW02G00214 [Tripterygium wilfordii]